MEQSSTQRCALCSEEACERRLARDRARRRQRLTLETAEQRQARLTQRRLHRASETEEARQHRLARDRARRRHRLASETAEEREARLSRRRVRDQARRQRRLATETPEEREGRLHQSRVREQQRLDAETPDEREGRLHQLRVSQQQRLAAETPDEREGRLHQLRLSQQQRLATETPDEREGRLHQLRVSQQQRLATETPDEREGRLHQLRVSQQQRLATETPDERDDRLHQLRVNHQQRVAAETPEQTEARRQRHRESHQPSTGDQPLLLQPAVQSKMHKFHSQLINLKTSTCITCMERFPGMTVRATSAGTECVRCSRDKHSPKTYSLDNNMHPGPVPLELLVCLYFMGLGVMLSILVPLSAGAYPGGGNAYLCSDAYHVHLQTASWTVWLQWTCGQPATGCGLLCSVSSQVAF